MTIKKREKTHQFIGTRTRTCASREVWRTCFSLNALVTVAVLGYRGKKTDYLDRLSIALVLTCGIIYFVVVREPPPSEREYFDQSPVGTRPKKTVVPCLRND